ncbi:MAG TPA: T9SS type A sorting domain-containing protein [Chitinophagales bacterium]|nr:T9SS type A sorting domain-containing protein [Chitinophagales bacterium]
MNKLLCFLTLFLISFSINAQALNPTILITPQDLGFKDKNDFFYVEEIDSQFIGLIVEKNIGDKAYHEAWLYDIENNQSISLIYKDSSGWQYSNGPMNLDLNMQNNGSSLFYIKENKVFTIINEMNSEAGSNKEFLLVTDLTSLEQKVVKVSDCFPIMSFLKTENYSFLVGHTDCSNQFNLYTFSEEEVSKVWSMDLSKNNYYFNIFGLYPFVHKDKMYVSDPSKLYVFDAATYELDTLIENVKDTLDEVDNVITFPSQYLVDNDEVYVVYSDIKYQLIYFSYKLLDKVGNARVWKTNGTKASTQLEYKILLEEDGSGNKEHSRLFSMNQGLYWLGDLNRKNNSTVYKLENKEMTSIGQFDALHNYDESYDMLTLKTGKDKKYYPIPLFNNSLHIKWKEKEYVPYIYSILSGKDNTTQLYVNMISVEKDKLNFIESEQPISINRNYSTKKYVYLSEFQITQNNKDQIGLFASGFINNDIGYQELSFLDYFVYENENLTPVDSFNVVYNGSSKFSYSYINKDVVFLFKDSLTNQMSLWSVNTKLATPIKNHTFTQKDIFKLYPNPSAQYITLESSEFLKGQMMIAGMDGKVYQTLNFSGHQKNLDISQLSAGMYMTVFVGDGITSTNTFVKSE